MITKEQAVPGAKVNIPTTKTSKYSGIQNSFEVREAKKRGQPFLFIVGWDGDEVVLAYMRSNGTGDCFSLSDLDLYEDPELSNPTSFPLSEPNTGLYARRNEALNDHLFGQTAAEAKERHKQTVEIVRKQQAEAAQFAPLKAVLDGFEQIMRYKNAQYGNTGLEPVGVFSKGDTLEKLLSRADDKVARIKNSPVLRKNDVVDLMGYLTLICAHQGWNDFTDQQD